MPEGKYHSMIKKAIYTVAKESKRHKRVYKEKKIPIPHPDISMKPIMYKPEVYIKTNLGKIYIFEILDSQMKDENLIIADIIQACLVENVKKIFFITKCEEEYGIAKRLSQIIYGILDANGYHKEDLPQVNGYFIEKKDLNQKKLYEIFKEYAKKDRWN